MPIYLQCNKPSLSVAESVTPKGVVKRRLTLEGDLVPTPEQPAIAQHKQVSEAQQRAFEAELRLQSQKLAEQLRSLGIDPDSLS